MTIYQVTMELPYHLSVGAVIFNPRGEVCCHHYLANCNPIGGDKDIWVLMRETMEDGETPEATLNRGALEEFGAIVLIENYLGSLISSFIRNKMNVQKTTLYFKCRLISQDLSLRSAGEENISIVEWKSAEFLIPIMQSSRELGRDDLDESEILIRSK